MNRNKQMLLAVRDHVLPLTQQEVAKGNHVFGGIILHKNTLAPVVAGSNNRLASPLFHGEIDTLNKFFAMKDRPAIEDVIFLATHDPCAMCAASIAWAGFKELWTLFDYEDVEASADMPIDKIMFQELFGCEGTTQVNRFFTKHSLKTAIMNDPEKDMLLPIFDEITTMYNNLHVQDFAYPSY